MRLLVAVALLSFVFTGCKKDCIKPDDTIPPLAPRPPQPMIKTIASANDQGYVANESFYYDSLWRLQVHITERFVPDPRIFTDSFRYGYPYLYINNASQYSLNADSLVYKDHFSTWYSQKTYSFNSNRNQVRVSSMVGSDTRTYDSNYNMVEKHSNVEVNPNRAYYDHYYTYNTYINTIGNYNKGEYHFGKSSVNLIEQEVYDWYLNGPTDSLMNYIEYTYAFNDSGWVSRLYTRDANVNRRYIDSVNFVIDTIYTYGTQQFTYY